MGSPAIFNGAFTKLLTSRGIVNSNGSLNEFDGDYNYIANGSFDQSITVPSGPTLFNTTMSGGLPTGSISAGASSLALSQDTSTPLLGSGSLQVTAASAWAAGQGFYFPTFTVQRAHLGQILTASFSYRAVSNGSSANWSGLLGSQTLIVYIYDVSNSVWIQPTGYLGMNQGIGSGIISVQFQASSSSGQQYRLVVLASQASSSSITMDFDNFVLGPQQYAVGPTIGAWTQYTPTATGLGTLSSTEMFYRQVGDFIQIAGNLTTGTVNGSTVAISLPIGVTSADTTKIPSARICGSFMRSGTNVSQGYVCLISPSSLSFNMGIQAAGSQFVGTVGTGFNNNELISMFLEFPVQGWSSNSQTSNSTDSRVVAGQTTGASASVSGSYSDVTWATVVSDTHGAFNGASSVTTYTIPVSGYYDFSGQIYASAASISAGNNFTIGLLNSTSSTTLLERTYVYEGTNTTSQAIAFCFEEVFLSAGTAIKIQVKANTTTPAITTSATQNFWAIGRRSGPAQIVAASTVATRYTGSSTSISGSLATVVWNTKDYDMTSSMASGIFTVPISGKYQINCNIQTTGTFTLNNILDMQLQLNGSVVSEQQVYAAAATTALNANISDIVNCAAGDQIRIQLSSGATGPAITNSSKSWISIMRLGYFN